jgi:hypothetical protein
MPRIDRSVAILTGVIVAALYVILLVGFSRESYMRRDAEARADGSGAAGVTVSKRVCRIVRPVCTEEAAAR